MASRGPGLAFKYGRHEHRDRGVERGDVCRGRIAAPARERIVKKKRDDRANDREIDERGDIGEARLELATRAPWRVRTGRATARRSPSTTSSGRRPTRLQLAATRADVTDGRSDRDCDERHGEPGAGRSLVGGDDLAPGQHRDPAGTEAAADHARSGARCPNSDAEYGEIDQCEDGRT